MANFLDVPLEDLIKKNKQQSGSNSNRGRGRGRGGGFGPARRFNNNNRAAGRPAPYATFRGPDAAAWNHDAYMDQAPMRMGGGGGAGGIETGTKLYISNLDYGVSNEDIKELFAEVGDLKRYSINYDRSARSKGTAEVVFSRRADALAAVKRYNNVQLDGKPMKIEVIGTNLETPTPGPLPFNMPYGNFNGPPTSGPGRGGPGGWAPRGGRGFGGRGRGGRGGGGGGGTGASNGNGNGNGGGRGRGGRGSRGKPVSAQDLDAELDKYHAEAMQIN